MAGKSKVTVVGAGNIGGTVALTAALYVTGARAAASEAPKVLELPGLGRRNLKGAPALSLFLLPVGPPGYL